MSAIQERNSQLIALLRQDFLHLDDPTRTRISTDNISNPPTDAEIDAAFDTPANLPSGFIGIIDDAGGSTVSYMVWPDDAKTAWFWAVGTLAL